MDFDYILTGKKKEQSSPSSSGGMDFDYIVRGSDSSTPVENRPSLNDDRKVSNALKSISGKVKSFFSNDVHSPADYEGLSNEQKLNRYIQEAKDAEVKSQFANSFIGKELNFARAIPDATKELVKDMGQYLARVVGTVGTGATNIAADFADKFNPLNTVYGTKAPRFDSEIPTDQLEITKKLFGGESIRDFENAGQNALKRGYELYDLLSGKETPTPVPKVSKPEAIGIGFIGAIADIWGVEDISALRKIATTIPEGFFKFVAKEENPIIIHSALQSAGVPENLSLELSKRFAKTKTVKEAKDVLLGPLGESDVPSAANVVEQTLIPRGVPDETAIKNLITTTVQNVKQNVPKEAPRPARTEVDLSSEQESKLFEEARKYKSAEEFVKAKTNAYHGTPGKEFDEFKLGVGRNTENETNGLGVWVTPQPEAAKVFSNKIEQGLFSGSSLKDVGGSVMPVSIQLKNPKVYTATKGMKSILDEIAVLEKERPSLSRASFTSDPVERRDLFDKRDEINKKIEQLRRQYQRDAFEVFMDDRDQFAEYIQKGAKWEDRYIANNVSETNKKFIEHLRKQGHDGIIIKSTAYDAKSAGLDSIDQIVVFDTKQVLTRKQLTDIYNKAVGWKPDNISTSIQKAKASGQSFDEWVKEQDGVINTELPVSKISTSEPSMAFSRLKDAPKRKVTEPIEVIQNVNPQAIKDYGEYVVLDGHHRLMQAKLNGDKTIPVKMSVIDEIEPGIQKDLTHSQLKAEWDKVEVETPKANTKGNRIPLSERLVQPERIVAYQKRLRLKGADPILVDIITTPENSRAYGVSYAGTISFEKIVQDFTEDHEMVHQIMSNLDRIPLFSKFSKEELFAEGRELYGQDLTDAQIEEEIALDLQQYVREREANAPVTMFGKIREFFDRLYAALKRLFKTDTNIKEFYRVMTEGKATEDTIISNEASEAFLRKAREQGRVDFRRMDVVSEFLKEVPVDGAFTDSGDLTLKTIQKLEGRANVSKQFIEDITNSGDIKQVERDLIRTFLESEGEVVNVPKFVDKVKAELLPLTIKDSDLYRASKKSSGYTGSEMAEEGYFTPKYENITLPDEVRGKVKTYKENIYESPIQTSAGTTHFQYTSDKYFGHTRIEDMADDATRRIIEVQSDLYQKGRLEEEYNIGFYKNMEVGNINPDIAKRIPEGDELIALDKLVHIEGKQNLPKKTVDRWNELAEKAFKTVKEVRKNEVVKLAQYNNPTAHFRMVREEIKRAAQDGKTKLQFPTGETAMKIEGLGETDNNQWLSASFDRHLTDSDGVKYSSNNKPLKEMVDDLYVGMPVKRGGDEWIITDVLGDGKFKAVQKSFVDLQPSNWKITLETEDGIVKPNNSTEKGLVWVARNEKTRKMDFQPFAPENKQNALDFLKEKIGKEDSSLKELSDKYGETFDISGKIDTNNPIYRFYEKDLGRYLKNNYNAIPVTDARGVKWYEVPITEEYGTMPVPAFLERKGDDIEKTPQEILAEAEAKARKPGNQQDRIRELADIAKIVDSYDEFLVKISNNPLWKQWRSDLPDNGFAHFADFFKYQKGLQSGKIIKIPPPVAKSVVETMEERPSMIEKSTVLKARSISPERIKLSPELERMREEIAIRKDSIEERYSRGLPISGLEKYVLQSGDMKGRLPEVTGTADASYLKKVRAEAPKEFAKKGDSIITEYGFDDVEDAQEALDKYQAEKQTISQLEKDFRIAKRDFIAEERDRFAIEGIVSRAEKQEALRKVEAILREEGRNRYSKVKAVQDHFNLTDAEMRGIVGSKDFRLLTDKEFDNLMKKIQGMAYDQSQLRDARMMVQSTIEQKELKKVENLRQAMKLPKIENMSLKQLDELDTLLQTFQTGDEFLGVRQLQTLKNTDISEIKTKREALEDLAKRTGTTVEDLKSIKINWLNKFESGTSLARQNPLFERMVMDTNEAKIAASVRFTEFKDELNRLVKEARRSRRKSLPGKLIPTDEMVFNYLESTEKSELSKVMTPQELELAQFIENKYAEVRDYLVEQGVLKKYRQNYITHVRRGFLEAWKEGGVFRGLKVAGKELFDNYKLEEANFNILNDQTGDVLPLEKFFKYSMSRSGNLVPSKNVAKAVMNYIRTFETKVALDSIVPKLDVYAHALTSSKTTPRGLEFDSSIKRFMKEWLNTQKGRPVDIGFLKAGDKLDWAIRSGVALTRLLDLALNIPVGLASNVGEQAMTFVELGTKQYAKGVARSFTKKGAEIIKKYETMVGETLAKRLSDGAKDIGDKVAQTFFSLFGIAVRKANIVEFLGMLTPEEFASGNVSSKRLAEIKNNMGKWRAVEDGLGSNLGKTAIGQVFRQYKSWAYPIASTTRHNLKVLIKMAKEGKNPVNSKEFAELFRATLVTVGLLFATYGIYSSLRDKKEKSFIENLAYKSMGDGLSLIGALDPSLWGSSARLISFVEDLTKSFSQVVASLAIGDRTKEGKIKGLKTLEQTITPKVVKMLAPSEKEDESTREVRKVYDEIQQLKAEGRNEEAVALAEKSFPDTPEGKAGFEIYKKIRSSEKTKETNVAVEDMKDTVKQIYDLKQSGNQEAIQEIVKDWDEEDLRIYQLAKKRYPPDGSVPEYKAGEEVLDQNLIDSVFTYAKAIGADPLTAFNRIFTNQRIRRVDNGTVIIMRNTKTFGKEGKSGFSEEVKKERGATKDQILDHTVPIQLGGADSRGNVKLIPVAIWEAYTPVENYLGKLLRDNKISKRKAQQLIKDFKNGIITFEAIKEQVQ